MVRELIVARLVDVMQDAVFTNTADRITYCNQALFNLVGVTSPAELLRSSPLALFDSSYHDLIRRRIEVRQAHCMGSGLYQPSPPVGFKVRRLARLPGRALRASRVGRPGLRAELEPALGP